MKIYGKCFKREEVLKRIGSLQQLAGSTRYTLDEGRGKGTSMIRMRNSTGIDLHIIVDKCMDVFDLSYKGQQLSWISKNGLVSNTHFESAGNGWLRSFGGGLLVTCGLTNVGPPVDDEAEVYGLHGRITSMPAKNVAIREYWENDTLYQEVSGEIRESNVFGENLVIYRTIKIGSDEPVIFLHDRIVNEGFKKEQLMILYHINWGFPLFNENSKLIIDSQETQLRGGGTMKSDEWLMFDKPVPDFKERVYFHDLRPDDREMLQYQIINDEIEMGVKVSWPKSHLPWFTEWKMLGESEYVLGLEPGNTLPVGRRSARESGIAEYLDPQSEKNVSLRIELLDLQEAKK
jgi:hypothetical protein